MQREEPLSYREKQVKRSMEAAEDLFWAKYDARIDNNTGHDDQ